MKMKNWLFVALIQDYHPLKQASLHIDDIAGVATRYEFMNSGGHINQASAHFRYQMSEKQDCMSI